MDGRAGTNRFRFETIFRNPERFPAELRTWLEMAGSRTCAGRIAVLAISFSDESGQDNMIIMKRKDFDRLAGDKTA